MYEKINAYIDGLISKSSPTLPMWNIESIKGGKSPHWNYIDGCMITSLLEIGRISGEKRYFDFAESFVDYYVNDDGSILGYDISKYNLDDVNEGRVLFELYERTGKEKYALAIERQAEHLRLQPRTNTGNFWHKAIYPDQIWLDGIYMAQPFSALYSRYTGGSFSDVISQVSNVYRYMRDKGTGLYYHGMDCSRKVFWADKETGLSKNFWLRSIGWYAVALVDLIDIVTDDEGLGSLVEIFASLMDSLLAFRDAESGMYWQVVNMPQREGNYLETSGSSMIAYAMLKGARLGVIDPKFASLGRETFDGICKRHLSFLADGTLGLGGICLVAGLGPEGNTRRDGSYEYYISEPIVENDAKGVAPFILAYTEILRGENK